MIDHALSGAMERLDVLLLDGFLRHEWNVRLAGRRADRFGIIAIIILTSDKWLNILRAYVLTW